MKLSVDVGAYVSFIRDITNGEVHVAVNSKAICEADVLGDRATAQEFVDEACTTCEQRVNPRAARTSFPSGGKFGQQVPPGFEKLSDALQKAVEENLPDFGEFAGQQGGFGIGFVVTDPDE